jgi:hypothetical protein
LTWHEGTARSGGTGQEEGGDATATNRYDATATNRYAEKGVKQFVGPKAQVREIECSLRRIQ